MTGSMLTAYVDETGTNELDVEKSNVSHLFICVAVLVDEQGDSVVGTEMGKISHDLCSGAEISGKRIGSDDRRRLRFLERITALPFGYYALVINKSRIPQDSGLQFKTSFYKFINRMLYQRLVQEGTGLRVIADQIGGKDFMDSFVPYLDSHGLPSLFTKFEHSFASSKETPLIQLADLIAGSLGYCFDEQKRGSSSSKFRELLRPREIAIESWPCEPASCDSQVRTDHGKPDEILQYSLRQRVIRFLEEYENCPDIERKMQARTLSFLLFARRFEDNERQAVVSDKLMERLNLEGFETLSKQAFQSRVIGKIRDEGIILAGANDGYRLALSVADIQDYLKHDKGIIEPMLQRVLKARQSVQTDTAGRYDALDDPEYTRLRKLADAFRDIQVTELATRANSSETSSSSTLKTVTP